ncbi:MAG: hypothetical protein EPO24_15705 [Bacteroidetes bacterium]|nr:MAG: hypothetical protein EPO24_15705 [Bacteroidota bacterium]
MILVLGISLLFGLMAQSYAGELKFDRYKTSDGLSQNNVYTITQDAQGYMWFGTQDGLSRFDGYSFTTFQNTDDTTSLASNGINVLYTDSKGILWVGAYGLHEYHPQTETFSRYLYSNSSEPGENVHTKNMIQAIYEDHRGDLWVGSAYGFCLFNRNTKKFEQLALCDSIKMGLDFRSVIHEDSRGRLWLGTTYSCFILNENRTSYSAITAPFNSLAPGIQINSMCEDSLGNIWIATWKGLYRHNITSASWTAYHHNAHDEQSLSDEHVNAVFCDRDGTLWVGTHEGLDRFNYETATFTHYRNEPEQPASLSHNRVHTMYQDASSVLWVGTFGGGVCKTLPFEKGFHVLRRPPTATGMHRSNMIFSILEDYRGRIWVGAWEDGLSVYDRSKRTFTHHGFPGVTISTLMEKSPGEVWVGKIGGVAVMDDNLSVVREYTLTEGEAGKAATLSRTIVGYTINQIFLFDATTSRFENITERLPELQKHLKREIQTIFEDNDSQVWVVGKLLFKLNFEPLSAQQINVGVLANTPEVPVMSILEDSSGVFWLATRGSGVVSYNKRTGESKRYTTEQGLPHNVVYGILEDNNRKLWFSTNNGLSRFDPITERFTNYTAEDGLQENEFNTGAFFKSKRGEMFFGGINGVTYFFPDSIRDNKRAPAIVLTGFQLFDRPYQFASILAQSKPLTLSRNENFFAFEYAVLDFVNPKENEFEYILDGFDSKWIYAGTRRRVSYTNVPPGEYVFRVKGSNNDGVWNEEGVSIAITILPAFWETWWFRAMAAFAILLLGPVIYNRRVTALKREQARQEEFSRELIESQERERKRIAAELHDGLGQELLIIKNKALLGAQATVQENKQTVLEEISRSVSGTLDVVGEIAYSLRPYQLESLGLTKALNALIKRAADSSSIAFSSEVANIDGMVSQHLEIDFYRVVQETITNILKHSEATTARISLTKTEQQLVLTIEDNGKGFDVNAARMKKGFGLRGLNERVKMLNGDISFDSHEHKGTTVTIIIPLEGNNGK